MPAATLLTKRAQWVNKCIMVVQCKVVYRLCKQVMGKVVYQGSTDRKFLNQSTQNFEHNTTVPTSSSKPIFITIATGVRLPNSAKLQFFPLLVTSHDYSLERTGRFSNMVCDQEVLLVGLIEGKKFSGEYLSKGHFAC
jgi:hypothetical protein